MLGVLIPPLDRQRIVGQYRDGIELLHGFHFHERSMLILIRGPGHSIMAVRLIASSYLVNVDQSPYWLHGGIRGLIDFCQQPSISN